KRCLIAVRIAPDLRARLASLPHKPQTSRTVKATSKPDLFRLLPSIDELLRNPRLEALAQREGRNATLEAARASLEQLRADITAGKFDEAQVRFRLGDLQRDVEQRLQQS